MEETTEPERCCGTCRHACSFSGTFCPYVVECTIDNGMKRWQPRGAKPLEPDKMCSTCRSGGIVGVCKDLASAHAKMCRDRGYDWWQPREEKECKTCRYVSGLACDPCTLLKETAKCFRDNYRYWQAKDG